MRRYSGWTLKETLIAVGVIVLLVALLFPVVQVVRYRAYETKCRANLWNIVLKYDDFKSQGYKGKELRKQVLFFVEDNPDIGRCPLSGEEYIVITEQGIQNHFGESWTHNPDVIVFCSCHVDPKKQYQMENCVRVIRNDEAPETWYLSGTDRDGKIEVRYAPHIVRVQHRHGADTIHHSSGGVRNKP